MTAAPTAIPHCEASAHHKPTTPPPAMESSSFSRSPTGTSPKPLVSPIYTSAGRSAFSLPGPNSASTSPTTTSWYSAGFASNNSQRVRSPSTVTPQRDSFFEQHAPAHYRATSFGSASRSSSISSADLMNEPTTPKAMDGVPLGRVPNGSFDQIKGHRGSWSTNGNAGWAGFNSLRGANGNSPPLSTVEVSPSSYSQRGSNMSGILNKFTFGGATARMPSSGPPAPVPISASLPSADEGFTVVQPVAVPSSRGRQASLGGGPTQKRRPSPMGERLLMGHFNAH